VSNDGIYLADRAILLILWIFFSLMSLKQLCPAFGVANVFVHVWMMDGAICLVRKNYAKMRLSLCLLLIELDNDNERVASLPHTSMLTMGHSLQKTRKQENRHDFRTHNYSN